MRLHERPRAAIAGAALLACLAAMSGPAPAQQVIPSATRAIPLWNASGSTLDFYVFERSGWQRRSLGPGAEAELPFEETVLAVATAQSAEDSAAFATPAIEPGTLAFASDGTAVSGPFFVRRVRTGERLELCWSGGRRQWVVARIGEGLCGPG